MGRKWHAHGTSVYAMSRKPIQPGWSGQTNISWSDQPSGSPWKAEVVEQTKDGWKVRWVWVEQGGVPILREVHVVPLRQREIPKRGLTSRRLNELLRTEQKL